MRRRNGGVVDRGGLENRCPGNWTGGSNPSFSAETEQPRTSGVVYFNEFPKKVCFLKEMSENKHNPTGFVLSMQGSPPGITASNPANSQRFNDPHQRGCLFLERNNNQLQAFSKTSTPFCPPKPNEFEIAASILTVRAKLGITSRSHSGSLVS